MAYKFCALLLTVALAACASKGKVRDEELGRIADWLPGQYDNSIQFDEDIKSVAADPHPPLEIVLAPVWARFVGDRVLYVEQTDTRSGRHVISQHLYVFDKSPDGKSVVQRVYDFKEPQRWTGGHKRPDIFKSMVKDDVTAVSACDLKWVLEDETFKGKAGRKGCTIRNMEFDGLYLRMELAGRPAGDFLKFKRVGAEE